MKIIINVLASKIKYYNNNRLIWTYDKFNLLSSKFKIKHNAHSYELRRKRFWNANVDMLKDGQSIGSITYKYAEAKINFNTGISYTVSIDAFANELIEVRNQHNHIVLTLIGNGEWLWKDITYDIQLKRRRININDIEEFLIFCAYAIRLVEFQNE